MQASVIEAFFLAGGKEKGLVKLLRRTPCSVPTAKQSVP